MRQAFIYAFLIVFQSFSFNQTAPKLTLSDCISIALQNSPYYRQIQSTKNRSATEVFTAITPLLPQFSLISEYSRTGPSDNNLFTVSPNLPAAPVQETGNIYQSNLSVEQTIIDASNWLGVKQAVTIKNASIYTAQASTADFVYNVKQAFYTLLQSYSSHTVAETTLSQNQEQATIARERYRLGAINQPDLLQVETAFLQSQSSLTKAAADLISSHRRLASLIGRDSFSIDTTLAFPDTTQKIPPLDSLKRKVIEKSPSILAAKQTTLADRVSRQRAWWSTAPVLSFTLTYGYSNNSFGFANWSDHNFYDINVSFIWNLFRGGSTIAQVRQTAAQTGVSEASEQITKSTALDQLQQAYGNLSAAFRSLSLVNPLLTQSNESYKLMLEKFRLGAASSADLLSSQLTFVQSTQQATSILIDYYTAYAEIIRILGEW